MSAPSLRNLLLGKPMMGRKKGGEAEVAAELDAVNARVIHLLARLYDDPSNADEDAGKNMAAELRSVSALPSDANGVTCRRALLVFCLAREPEVAGIFADAEYARDLRDRVGPFFVPSFLDNSCQRPDALVAACVVASEMWRGERLGNWPRPRPDAAAGSAEAEA